MACELTDIEPVAAGGSCIVGRGYSPTLGRHVAVKVARLATPDATVARFLAEADVLQRIHHPSVVSTYGAGLLAKPIPDLVAPANAPFILMELAKGGTLADQSLATDSLWLSWTRQILNGLACVHANGVVHRDIKPLNILVEHHSSRALLADFGVATFSGADRGTRVGTLPWMAPEQLDETVGHVGPWSDLYALGLLVARRFYGLHMPAGGTHRQQLTARNQLRIGNERGASMRKWVSRLLAVSPVDRFRSAWDALGEMSALSLSGESPPQARDLANTMTGTYSAWAVESAPPTDVPTVTNPSVPTSPLSTQSLIGRDAELDAAGSAILSRQGGHHHIRTADGLGTTVFLAELANQLRAAGLIVLSVEGDAPAGQLRAQVRSQLPIPNVHLLRSELDRLALERAEATSAMQLLTGGAVSPSALPSAIGLVGQFAAQRAHTVLIFDRPDRDFGAAELALLSRMGGKITLVVASSESPFAVPVSTTVLPPLSPWVMHQIATRTPHTVNSQLLSVADGRPGVYFAGMRASDPEPIVLPRETSAREQVLQLWMAYKHGGGSALNFIVEKGRHAAGLAWMVQHGHVVEIAGHDRWTWNPDDIPIPVFDCQSSQESRERSSLVLLNAMNGAESQELRLAQVRIAARLGPEVGLCHTRRELFRAHSEVWASGLRELVGIYETLLGPDADRDALLTTIRGTLAIMQGDTSDGFLRTLGL